MKKILIFNILILLLFATPVFSQDTLSDFSFNYIGSSTVGNFISEAIPLYDKANFNINTRPESAGGELAIIEGRADLAGIARTPDQEVLARGVVSTLIGWDAIAIIVHKDNPVLNLTETQLKQIYTGVVRNWNEFGGPDLAIKPYIVDIQSATRKVCRSVILKNEDYIDCEVVSPDIDIIDKVAGNPGAIGHISFSFLKSSPLVRSVSINGQELSLTNSNYPITRPLYLLWWPGRRDVADFVDWSLSNEGQRTLMKNFIGVQESLVDLSQRSGSLMVYTETSVVEDGGIFYYPHLSYDILDEERNHMMTVANHMNSNDESPTLVDLIPGNYIIRLVNKKGESEEYFVSIQTGKTTKVFALNQSIKKTISKNSSQDIKIALPEAHSTTGSNMFNFYGDFRVRGEQDIKSSNNRFRGRVRIRAGMTTKINSSSRFDLRLVSTSDPDDPNSSHVSLDNGFDQIKVAFDRAYFHYFTKRSINFDWRIGKFSNPFSSSDVYSELLWDADIQPEGTAFTFSKSSRKNHKFSFTNGFYLLSQFKFDTQKTWLNSSQMWTKFALSDHISLRLAGSFYYFSNIKDVETHASNLDENEGNSTYKKMHLEGIDTVYTEHYKTDFHLLNTFAVLQINHLPQPLIFKAEFINNLGADTDNAAFVLGASYGELKHKSQYKIYYQYHRIERDAVFTPFAQDDALSKSNTAGHILGVAYNFHQKISLHAMGLFDSPMEEGVEAQKRFRLDLNIKF